MINKNLLLKHLSILYDSYKKNYSIDRSLIPTHTDVFRYRDAAAQIKLLMLQIRTTLPDNDPEPKRVDITVGAA